MQLEREKIYYIDKMRILMKEEKRELERKLPLVKLNQFSGRCHLGESSTPARRGGYRSTIEIEQPEREALLLLAQHYHKMPSSRISYIELAHDTLFTTKKESLSLFGFILKHTRRKYNKKHTIYSADGFESTNKTKRVKNTKAKYSSKTGYWGGKMARLVKYPCISKIANVPCIHKEFRLRGASNIKKRTEIASVKDLVDFDFERFFSKQDEKYLKYERVNYEKLGCWINNISSRANVTTYFGRDKQFAYNKAERAGKLFCRIHRIESVAGLRQYLSVVREIINNRQGRRSIWQRKIVILKYSRLCTFFTSFDYNF